MFLSTLTIYIRICLDLSQSDIPFDMHILSNCPESKLSNQFYLLPWINFPFFVNLSWFGLNQSNIFFLSGGDWVLNIKSAARGTLIEKFKPARQHNQPAQAKLDK